VFTLICYRTLSKCWQKYMLGTSTSYNNFQNHYTFFLSEFKFYSCICPPHERVTSWCRLYTRTKFLPLEILGANITTSIQRPPVFATFFQNSHVSEIVKIYTLVALESLAIITEVKSLELLLLPEIFGEHLVAVETICYSIVKCH
jgi:hypothetical protein